MPTEIKIRGIRAPQNGSNSPDSNLQTDEKDNPKSPAPMGEWMETALNFKEEGEAENLLTTLFKILGSIRSRRRDYKAKPIAIEGILRVFVCFNEYMVDTLWTDPPNDAFQANKHTVLCTAYYSLREMVENLRVDVRQIQSSGAYDSNLEDTKKRKR